MFEYYASKFISCVALRVPETFRYLVFTSPLSARSPDLCMLWHNGYRIKHRKRIILKMIFNLAISGFKGSCRLFINSSNYSYKLFGKPRDTILVAPAFCGKTDSQGEYKTVYIKNEPDDFIFIFGNSSLCGSDCVPIDKIGIGTKLEIVFYLMRGVIFTSFANGFAMSEKALILFVWIDWVISLKWLSELYLEKAFGLTMERCNITKVGCIHEMHAYARVVWHVAMKYNAKKYTIQHASISDGKRWYFCYPDEYSSGLVSPDCMYVFNLEVIEVLRPWFKNLVFKLGCSSRYAHWKNVECISQMPGSYYLFVGALANFDNDILIKCLTKIVTNKCNQIHIRIRLHPLANISRKNNRWLKLMQKKGVVSVSVGIDLVDDISKSVCVVGMSTTVLEEALLLGKPVIQLSSSDYLTYINLRGVNGSIVKDYREVTLKDLEDASLLSVDQQHLKNTFGLNYDEVTYLKLFSVDNDNYS